MLKRPIVFFFDSVSPFNIDETKILLNHDDKLRLSKISSAKKKEEFLTSRLFLNSILTNYFKVSPNVFKKDKDGKPYLEGEDKSISISHSAGKYALAFAGAASKIGIDIEAKSVNTNLLDIARNYFSQAEYKILKEINTERDRLIRFRQLWSLKESYYKVCEEKHALEQVLNVSFDLLEKKAMFLSDNKNENRLKFFSYADSDVSIALCLLGEQNELPKYLECQDPELVSMVSSSKEFEEIYF